MRQGSAIMLCGVLLIAVALAAGCQQAPVTQPAASPAFVETANISAATTFTATPAPAATNTALHTATTSPPLNETPTETPRPPAASPAAVATAATATVATATPAIDLIFDNRDPRVTSSGSWFLGDGGQSYNGDCLWSPRSSSNFAYVDPKLPVGGLYEIFAWWCGDPHHDQADRAVIEVYPVRGRIVPFQVTVNYQENAGQWNSLGRYNLADTAALSIPSSLNGNVVADAYRFVYRGPQGVEVTPTPMPTPQIWTNHPPSPLEQLTSGDLSMRLGLVQFYYLYTSMISNTPQTFDDCQAFPRDGCGGTRNGWSVQVQYEDMVVPYRVSDDYHHVAIEPPDELKGRQVLYLAGSGSLGYVRVDRYIDDTWHWSSTEPEGGPVGSGILDPAAVASLKDIATRVSTVRLSDMGTEWTFFGFGPNVEPDDSDRDRLMEIVRALAQQAWP